MALRPVGKTRVAEDIVRQLVGLILNGRIAVGEKPPPERRLSEELGVNRASLREAIKRIEHLGLVRTRQGDGTRVLDFMRTAGVDLVAHLAGEPLGLAMLGDVVEFRRWFGKECARLAAERAGESELADLERAARRSEEPGVDGAALVIADFDFYVALAHASKNRVMQLLINTMRQPVESFAQVFAELMPPADAVRAHHQGLIAAIAARDAARAQALADAYLGQAKPG